MTLRTVTVEVDLLIEDSSVTAGDANRALGQLIMDFGGSLRRAGIVNVGGGRIARITEHQED